MTALRKSQRGVTLIELMIAMLVLAVGFGAIFTLISVALASNNKNSKDTSATLLAQMVIEQISSQHPNSTTTITVTDCAGNSWTVATASGTAPNGTGANLITSSSSLSYGGIDQTQALAGFHRAMQCSMWIVQTMVLRHTTFAGMS